MVEWQSITSCAMNLSVCVMIRELNIKARSDSRQNHACVGPQSAGEVLEDLNCFLRTPNFRRYVPNSPILRL